jgi:pheromone a factor receptor
MTIYHLFKHKRQVNKIMFSNPGLNQDRYIRLMMLASVDMLATTPLSTYFMVGVIKLGFPKYSWAVLRHNYSHIPQFPSIVWKSNSESIAAVELSRWSLVLCAFTFFAFFGFADDARDHYRRAYTSLARRVGYSTPSGALTGSSHAYVVHSTLWIRKLLAGSYLFSAFSNKAAGVMISVKPGVRRDSTVSLSDGLSIPSISIANDLQPDFKSELDSSSEPIASTSTSNFAEGSRGRLPQVLDTANSTVQSMSTCSADAADAV